MKSLNKQVVNKLIKKKITISVAESCTGGLLSSAITSISRSSQIFSYGLVTYSNDSKIKILKVSKKIINTYGAVSSQCCLSMVKNLGKISKSYLCVSITGIAGPTGGSKEKPVGLVYIGIKKGRIIKVNKCLFKNNGRRFIQKASLKMALKLILRSIK
jgi:nicotinamide-nucleotide amidase